MPTARKLSEPQRPLEKRNRIRTGSKLSWHKFQINQRRRCLSPKPKNVAPFTPGAAYVTNTGIAPGGNIQAAIDAAVQECTALTGPIARGDYAVVTRQLSALSDWDEDLALAYAALGRIALQLSSKQGSASKQDPEAFQEGLIRKV